MFTSIKAKLINNLQKYIMNKVSLKDKKVLRFILVGALNTLLGFFLFPLIYFTFSEYQHNYVLMLIISQLVCMLFSFFSNKIYVFRSHNKVSLELIKFICFHGFYFFVSIKINPAIVNKFGIHPIIVQTVLNVLIVLTSYFWYDKINFVPSKIREV